jgi:hypothetical protein
MSDPPTSTRVVDDLIIQHLADTEAELRARVADLEADLDAYRLLAKAAIDRCAALTITTTRQRDRLIAITDELRALHALRQQAA